MFKTVLKKQLLGIETSTFVVVHQTLSVIFCLFWALGIFAQSPSNDFCNTAKSITFNQDGRNCQFHSKDNPTESGFTVVQNAGCSKGLQGPDLWYKFIAIGSSLKIELKPLGGTPIRNPLIFLYSGNCGNYNLIKCASNIGSNPATLEATVVPGDEYFVIIASNSSEFGHFELCFTNNADTDDPGDRCQVAGRVCNKSTLTFETLNNYQASGTFPSCFSFEARRDVWLKFTVSKSGSLEFIIDPDGGSEFDWALFDISNGCPDPADPRPQAIKCNYNYANETGAPTGMSPSAGSYPAPGEISDPINVTQGKTYALLIDNFSKSNDGFTIEWAGSFEIISSDFEASNLSGCDSVLVSFDHPVLPDHSYEWDFGDGTTFTGPNPPDKLYKEEGTFIISLAVEDLNSGCDAVSTQVVTLSQPKMQLSYPQTEICEGIEQYLSTSVILTGFESPLSFKNPQDRSIADNNPTGIKSGIDVQIPNAGLVQPGDIKKVCVNIQHKNVGDLKLSLEAPDGSRIVLVNQEGGDNDNFENTCFVAGATGSITGGTAPFTGNFAPQDNFNDLGGSPINGTWYLIVADVSTGIVGLLDDWEISINNENKADITWGPPELFADPNKSFQNISFGPVSQDTVYSIDISVTDRLGCSRDSTIEIRVKDSGEAGDDHEVQLCNEGSYNLFSGYSRTPDSGGRWEAINSAFAFNTSTGEISDLSGYTEGSYEFRYFPILGGNCSDNYSTVILNIIEQEEAGRDSTALVCASNQAINLNDYLSADRDPNGNWVAISSGTNFNSQTAVLQVSNLNGTYKYSYYHDAKLNCSPDSAIITVIVNKSPEIFVDSLSCNAANNAYKVYARLSGGDPSTYQVTPTTGTITGNRFISDFHVTGSNYNYTLRDQYGCSPLNGVNNNINGKYACDCKTNAGSIQQRSTRVLCVEDSTRIAHNQDHELDANDVIFMVIHQNKVFDATEIIYQLSYAPFYDISHQDFPGLPRGDTVYVSYIAGDADANGFPDYTDPSGCLNISASVGIYIHPKLEITFNPLYQEPLCEGNPIELEISLASEYYPLSFLANGSAMQSTSSSDHFLDYGTQFPQYQVQLDSFSDGYGCRIDTSVSFSSEVNQAVKHQVLDIFCNPNNTDYQVKISLQYDPNRSVSQRGTTNFTDLGNNEYLSDEIPSGTPFNAIFNYGTNTCPDDTVAGIHYCDCGSFAGEIERLARNTYCYNESISLVDSIAWVLEPNDTVNHVVATDSSDLNSVIKQNAAQNITLDGIIPGQRYFVARAVANQIGQGLVDLNDSCLSLSTWQEFLFLPNLDLSLSATPDSLCQGTSLNLDISLTRSAFKDVELVLRDSSVDGISTNALSISQGEQNLTIPLNTNSSGWHNLRINQLGYQSSPNCIRDTTWEFSYYVSPTPRARILYNYTACENGDSTRLLLVVDAGDLPLEAEILSTYAPFITTLDKDSNYIAVKYPPGDYNFLGGKLTQIGGQGCEGDIVANSFLKVFEQPRLEDVILDAVLCENAVHDFSLVFAGDNPEYSFDAEINNQGGNNYSTVANKAEFNNVLVGNALNIEISNLQSNFGCVGPDTNIVLQAVPRPTIILPDSLDLCQGLQAEIENKISGSAPFELIISENSGDRDTITLSNENISIGAAQQYNWIYLHQLSDASTCIAASLPDSVYVERHPIPASQLVVLNDSGCVEIDAKLYQETSNVNLADCFIEIDGQSQSLCDTLFARISKDGVHNVMLRTISDKGCILDTLIPHNFIVAPLPKVDFSISPRKVSKLNTVVYFTNGTPGNNRYKWDFGGLDSSKVFSPVYEFPSKDTGSYEVTLIAESNFGCIDSLSKVVIVSDKINVFIPTAFTPDNDGINDVFRPVFPYADSDFYRMKVFNRWGEELYSGEDPSEGWNGYYKGELVPQGYYSVQIQLKTVYDDSANTFYAKVLVLR